MSSTPMNVITFFNPLKSNVPFLYPLKLTSENLQKRQKATGFLTIS